MRAITCVFIVSLAVPGIALAAGDASTRVTARQGSAGTGHFNGWIDADNARHPGSPVAFGCRGAWEWDGLEFDLLLATAPLNYSALWWDAVPCVFAGDDGDARYRPRRAYNTGP
jgi:hypothetical protein